MGLHNYSDIPNNTAAKWHKDPGLRKGFFHICILYCCVFALGFDGSLLNGLQAIPAWVEDFVSSLQRDQEDLGQKLTEPQNHPAGTRLGLIAATYYLPKIPTTFVVAYMVDRLGRKIPLYIGSVFMIAGAFVGGFAHNVGTLMGSRVLLGIGTAFAQITACAMVPELAHPRMRHHAGSFLNTTYYIGSIFAAWLTFAMVYYPGGGSWSWRIPTLVQGFGPVLLLAAVLVPESPRWLVRNGREAEAHKILATYHANGELDDPLVLMEMREIRASVEIEKISSNSSWLSFFKTRGNIRRFLIIIMLGTATQWSGNGVVQYFLVPVLKTVGITRPPQTAGINGGLSIFNWFSAILGASLVERMGRRKLFLLAYGGMLASFCLITALSGAYNGTKQKPTGVAMVPFIFVFSGFYSLAMTPLPMLYTPEISPTSLRAKSAALLLLSQNCAQSFNQFANPVALAAIGWKYYFVYVAVLTTYLILFFLFIRETRGLTVEEAAVVYDDDDVKEAAMAEERRWQEEAATQGRSGEYDLKVAKSIQEEELKKDGV